MAVVGGGGVRGLCGWCNWGGVLWSELTTGGIGLCTPANVAQKLTGREKEVCKIMLLTSTDCRGPILISMFSISIAAQ